jgi:hypothetical protein
MPCHNPPHHAIFRHITPYHAMGLWCGMMMWDYDAGWWMWCHGMIMRNDDATTWLWWPFGFEDMFRLGDTIGETWLG